MIKNCRNCVQFALQTYNSERQAAGRCMHVSFQKAGFSPPPAIAGHDPDQFAFDNITERPTLAETLEQFARGWWLHDQIDIKLTRPRFCQHWKSPLTMIEEILEYYQDTIQYVLDYPKLAPALKDWLLAGLPRDARHYPKLNRISTLEFDGEEVPEPTLAAYEPCQTCNKFEQALNEDGTPVPFRGRCMQKMYDRGVYALGIPDRDMHVYTFMGCTEYQALIPITPADPPTDLPARLTIFVETNPMVFTVDQYQQMYKFPTVTRNKDIEAGKYAALMGVDLVPLLRERRSSVDFDQFNADFSLNFVNEYFSKGLQEGTRSTKAKWAPLDHYKHAELKLFGEKPAATSEAASPEETVAAEFGATGGFVDPTP